MATILFLLFSQSLWFGLAAEVPIPRMQRQINQLDKRRIREPRALSVIAETDLTCLRIGEEEFQAVVENDAAVACKLLQAVAGYVSN